MSSYRRVCYAGPALSPTCASLEELRHPFAKYSYNRDRKSWTLTCSPGKTPKQRGICRLFYRGQCSHFSPYVLCIARVFFTPRFCLFHVFRQLLSHFAIGHYPASPNAPRSRTIEMGTWAVGIDWMILGDHECTLLRSLHVSLRRTRS